jgi:putative FmdB family regulatory protein
MPTYTYYCEKCQSSFDLFANISDYKDKVKCPSCKVICSRDYQEDMLTLNSSVRKSDSELKTLGDLAQRNTERFSDDYKAELQRKHYDYRGKEDTNTVLPDGMSRIERGQKTIWPK